MKIAVFYPHTKLAGWSDTLGIVATLRRMKHEVLPGAVPTVQGEVPASYLESVRARLPDLAALKTCDAILMSGPEHLAPWLAAVYGAYEWKHELPMPKLGLYHESMWREDVSFGDIWDQIRIWSDHHFFPAVQDAEFFDQEHLEKGRAHWLPFGVDTAIFRPGFADGRLPRFVGIERNPTGHLPQMITVSKLYDVAFIGSVYGKRAGFLNALARHETPVIQVGGVQIQDLSGPCLEEQARRMAMNIRQVKVFLNLPALSALLVSKVWEVLACGTFLMTPLLNPERGAAKNHQLFESGKHLVYYRAANVGGVAAELRKWVSPEHGAEREAIARAGCDLVHREHSLEQRLAKALAQVTKPLVLAAS